MKPPIYLCECTVVGSCWVVGGGGGRGEESIKDFVNAVRCE